VQKPPNRGAVDLNAALGKLDSRLSLVSARVELTSGKCTGAEALLRWNHPALENFTLGEFILLGSFPKAAS
jgi:sensor c-di-GMP phosphodiesterase-like protein